MIGRITRELGGSYHRKLSEYLRKNIFSPRKGVDGRRGIRLSGPPAISTEALANNWVFTKRWCFTSTKRECARKKSAPSKGWETLATTKAQRNTPSGICMVNVLVPKVDIWLPLAARRLAPVCPFSQSNLVAGTTLISAPVSTKNFRLDRLS